jgi:hypothetical protein
MPRARTLVYLERMRFPTEETRAFQITRTVAALAQRTDTILAVESLTTDPGRLSAEVERIHGARLPARLEVIVVPGCMWRPWFFPFLLRYLRRVAGGEVDFYTRSFRTALLLARWRRFHHGLVALESHKKAGFLREDPVPGSRYAPIRERFERAGDSEAAIRSTYAAVDCVFFLHRHSRLAAERQGAVRAAEDLWYGMEPPGPDTSPRGSGLVFAGSLEEHKLFDLLCDSLDGIEPPAPVAVYGGTPGRIEEIRRKLAGRPCAGRLVFHGRIPRAELRRELGRYGHGIALQEGLKVVDYLESGLTPIVPDIPSYREVLDERFAVFFRPDDPDALARVLGDPALRTADGALVRALRLEHSVDRRADRIVARLGQLR